MNVTKMTFRFYDRTKEPADLRAFSRQVEDDASRMIIISSRRRIGRTTLANPAFTNGPLPCLFSISAMKKPPKPTLRLFGGFMLRHWAWNIFRLLRSCRKFRLFLPVFPPFFLGAPLQSFRHSGIILRNYFQHKPASGRVYRKA